MRTAAKCKRAHPFAAVLLDASWDMLGCFLDHLHLGVLLNDGSMGGSEPEETRKSADEVSHTISVSTSALLAF